MAQIDFSPIGDLASIYQQAQQRAERSRILNEVAQGSGPLDENVARRLLPVDPQAAMSLASLANNARDFQFRQQEAQRAQGNTDRSFALQQKQAEEAARGFDYREIDDGQGGKSLVKIHKATGEISRPDISGAQTAPNNPFMTGGKMNESQSKDGLYASRMLNSERVLRDPAVISAATSLREQGLSRIPVAGNYMVSTAFQKYDQAQRDFINATLRRESGAVISDSEFDNARKQYFPQPGDSEEKLAQKQKNRIEAIKGIGAGAGPGYRPSLTINEAGEVVDNPAATAKKPQAGSLPRVASPAEAAKLPKGTRFLDPNGVERIVP